MDENEEQYMTDTEVCDMLRITQNTLRRLIENGPPESKPGIDIRKANPITIGGQRRWNRLRFMALLNTTNEA